MEHPCELLLGLFGVRGGLKVYASGLEHHTIQIAANSVRLL